VIVQVSAAEKLLSGLLQPETEAWIFFKKILFKYKIAKNKYQNKTIANIISCRPLRSSGQLSIGYPGVFLFVLVCMRNYFVLQS
jgi:hypothetical protein